MRIAIVLFSALVISVSLKARCSMGKKKPGRKTTSGSASSAKSTVSRRLADVKKLGLSADELRAELALRATKKSYLSPPVSTALASYDDATLVAVLKEEQKVIYGVDNRVEIFDVPGRPNVVDADSVVALFDATDVTNNADGTSTLRTVNFGTSRNLCTSEPFRTQPVGAFCSGFLVAPDIIATAGHCVNNANVAQVRFIFGFRMQNPTTAQTRINTDEIYSGVSVIQRQENANGADFALVRIDRRVTNHHISPIRRNGKIANSQSVHVIGHPCGLPAKFADGAKVRINNASDFFVANLDTYGGNSGSPVFNSNTHEVEGILVRGETDFVMQGSCRVSLVCPTNGCSGESSTRATVFQQWIPVLSPIRAALLHPNGKAYFFRDDLYQRYDFGQDVVDKIGRTGISGWKGLWKDSIGAALMHPNGKAYFFREDRYQRFNFSIEEVDKEGRIGIDGWSGLWRDGIEAAVLHPNGKAYFFRGSRYQRFDFEANEVDKEATIGVHGWLGLWDDGLDAATMHPNGKAYFFRAGKYQRFDFGQNAVDKTARIGIDGWWGVWPS